MPRWSNLLNPRTWFGLKGRAEEDTRITQHDARRGIKAAPKKRKAEDDLLAVGRKRLRLEQEDLNHHSVDPLQESSADKYSAPCKTLAVDFPQRAESSGPYWSRFNIFDWVNRSARTGGHTNSSIAHASKVADFDCQAQLKQAAANDPDCREEVAIQVKHTPHTDNKGVPRAHRTSEMPPRPKTFQYQETVPSTPTGRRRNRRSGDRNGAVHTDAVKGGPNLNQIADISTILPNDIRETGSVAPTTASKRQFAQDDEFSLEQARRHAAAVKLPRNSGIWALSEKQLFYHLSLRGFEPLLPENWMVDFKTLPLSLFANDNTDAPLIQAMEGKEFRAVRALRDLVDTGKTVRDKAFAGPNFHAEKTIMKSIKDYFAWALADGDYDLAHDDYVPVYHIMTRKKGQNTTEAMTSLNARLCTLAARHRECYGIASSVESGGPNSLSDELKNKNTAVYDDSEVREPPVLVGMLIVSTIVAIFTLNPYNNKFSDSEVNDDIDNSGLRFIAKFDFSDAQYDVWNAVAVAIAAVHVRSIMEIKGFPKTVRIKQESMVNGETPAKRKATGKPKVAGNAKAKGKGKNVVNAGWFHGEGYEINDDDPDL